MKNWTQSDIPDQSGRFAVVTGTGGLGYETALALAAKGANVILAGRNENKGLVSVKKIRSQHPDAQIAFEQLDLASLASVTHFVSRYSTSQSKCDLLINNAGVMTPPARRETQDGFELQFGTNYLGHFALTAHLLPFLRHANQPRIVHVSSGAHRLGGHIHFDNLQWTNSYNPWLAYAQSKLANLLFALELQRRSDQLGWGLTSNAAHPGYARTELIPNGPGAKGFSWLFNKYIFQRIASHSPAEGALPTLFAATSAEAAGAGYYGPRDFFELKGPPVSAVIGKQAKDSAVAERLWDISEQLTGVFFPKDKSLDRQM